jgi:hypothetical protein
MVIWSGLGFLVAVITFGCLLLTEFVAESAFHDGSYYQTHGWPKLVGFLAAALIVWPLGRYLNPKRGRVLIDPESGRQVVFKSGHTLFFVPMEYWGPVLVVLGIIFLFVRE